MIPYMDNKKEKTMTDIIHCLKCDDTYPEKEQIVTTCPTCGNDDLSSTVYLQKKYKVTIRGTITKTIEVEADDAAEAEEEAKEEANELFNFSVDGRDEKYEQDLINIEEVVI